MSASDWHPSRVPSDEIVRYAAAQLGPGWVLLDRPLAGGREAARYALLHPARGVALLDAGPAVRRDAADAARALLAAHGDPPVVHLGLSVLDTLDLEGVLDEAFGGAAAPADPAWVEDARRRLSPPEGKPRERAAADLSLAGLRGRAPALLGIAALLALPLALSALPRKAPAPPPPAVEAAPAPMPAALPVQPPAPPPAPAAQPAPQPPPAPVPSEPAAASRPSAKPPAKAKPQRQRRAERERPREEHRVVVRSTGKCGWILSKLRLGRSLSPREERLLLTRCTAPYRG